MAPKKEAFTMKLKPEKATKTNKVEKLDKKKSGPAVKPLKEVLKKEVKQSKLQKVDKPVKIGKPVKNEKPTKMEKSTKNKTPAKVEKSAKIEKGKKVPAQKVPLVLAPKPEDEKTITPKVKDKKKLKDCVMPSKSVTEDLVKKCVAALDKLSDHHKKGNKIFDDESAIFAEINCIKIQTTKGNIRFEFPNSTVPSTGEVCLITPDLKKGKKVDHEPSVDHWEELIRKAGVTSVKTVLPMRQLRVEYDQFELKRRLLTQHDFIMVDTRVLNHVSHLLGKMFFKKHNMLIPVRVNEKNLKKSIDVGMRTAMLRVNIGPTSTIQVGHTGMDQKLIRENVMSLIQQLIDKFPGGEGNIRSISLKLPLSLSIPLYLTLRPTETVSAPRLVKNMPKNYSIVEDELSTLPGKRVAVAPDGTVIVKSSEDASDMEEDLETGDEGEEAASDGEQSD